MASVAVIKKSLQVLEDRKVGSKARIVKEQTNLAGIEQKIAELKGELETKKADMQSKIDALQAEIDGEDDA